jgi:hypothetical protein
MNERKVRHHGHGLPDGEHIPQEHPPYWKRAHRDWRFWIGVFLFLAAITIYVMSDDLALIRHSQPQQPVSGAAGK